MQATDDSGTRRQHHQLLHAHPRQEQVSGCLSCPVVPSCPVESLDRQLVMSVTAPHRTSPHLTTPHHPHLTAPHLTAPHRTAPHRTSPHLTSPHLTSPHHTTPHLTSSVHVIHTAPVTRQSGCQLHHAQHS